ncbi:DNA-binding protein RFX2, partial [Ophiophagus hannah]
RRVLRSHPPEAPADRPVQTRAHPGLDAELRPPLVPNPGGDSHPGRSPACSRCVTLQQQSSLDQWARWLGEVVSQVLKPHEGAASFPRAARQFLLKWSFYSSMVIRDLTLRSAASFGSFHLIRLLYDEYMFYLVEHRVAEATGETPIAVMGEFSDLASLSPAVLEKGRDPLAFLHEEGSPTHPHPRVKLGPSFSFPTDAFGTLGHEAGARMKPRVKREHSDPGPSLQEI